MPIYQGAWRWSSAAALPGTSSLDASGGSAAALCPFLAPAESHARTATVAVTRTDTSGSLDVLAEVLHQAVRESDFP